VIRGISSRFAYAPISPAVRSVIHLLNLGPYLAIHESREAALAPIG